MLNEWHALDHALTTSLSTGFVKRQLIATLEFIADLSPTYLRYALKTRSVPDQIRSDQIRSDQIRSDRLHRGAA